MVHAFKLIQLILLICQSLFHAENANLEEEHINIYIGHITLDNILRDGLYNFESRLFIISKIQSQNNVVKLPLNMCF